MVLSGTEQQHQSLSSHFQKLWDQRHPSQHPSLIYSNCFLLLHWWQWWWSRQTSTHVRCLVRKQKPIGTNVNESEILAFLGMAIFMGVNQLPVLAHYWRKDPVFHYSPVAERISRDRFLAIWRFLHFADNSRLPDRTDPDYDRLFKIRPVISCQWGMPPELSRVPTSINWWSNGGFQRQKLHEAVHAYEAH